MPGCRIQPLLLYNRITSSFSGLHKQLSSCWFSKLLLNIGDDSFVPLYFTARLALADQRNLFCLPSWWLVDTSLWPLNWRPHIDKAKCWPVSSTRYYPRPAKGERTLVKASLENPLTKKKKKMARRDCSHMNTFWRRRCRDWPPRNRMLQGPQVWAVGCPWHSNEMALWKICLPKSQRRGHCCYAIKD